LTRAAFVAGLRKFNPEGAPPFTPRQLLHYEMRHRMPASFIVDTSKAWDKKARAIACHASQLTRRDPATATLINSQLALEAIEARDRSRGSQIGVTHGEALYSPQTIGLVDPLAHFRANPFAQAHAFETPR
jgi:LmbE family N-acetylglucosaminyl deacetylase